MTRMVRGLSCLHLVGSAVAVLFFAGPALAFDVTACGQAVPPGEEGVLMADLVCDRLPQGNPPAVTVGSRGTLNLNGHTITAPHNTAVTANTGGISVLGPGELTGNSIAIQGFGPLTVTNVSIHDNQVGIITDLDSRRGTVRATNVSIMNSIDDFGNGGPGLGLQANTVIADGLTVTNATFDGLFIRRIRGRNVIASDNGHGHPICGGLGFGIVADTVHLANLTAQNNGSAGVIANKRLILRDSTVTGNTGEFTCNIDVFAERRPDLRNTICGKSNGWHVCQNDSPSGAFLDASENF